MAKRKSENHELTEPEAFDMLCQGIRKLHELTDRLLGYLTDQAKAKHEATLRKTANRKSTAWADECRAFLTACRVRPMTTRKRARDSSSQRRGSAIRAAACLPLKVDR